MRRLSRVLPVALSLLAGAAALVGCKQGENERCEIQTDCEDGLQCVETTAGSRICCRDILCGAGAARSDAAPSPAPADAGAADAGAADSGAPAAQDGAPAADTSPDAPASSVDAPQPSPVDAMSDAARADASAGG